MKGLSLGLSLSRSTGAAFGPLSLFASGEKGVWYDPSDLSTMYQSGTRASPGAAVSADGDPVGLILDKSGNNFDATQATAGNKWIYRTAGGKRWLESDGARFFDVPQVKATVSDWTMCAAVHQTIDANPYRYILDSPTGRLVFATLENSTNLSYFDGTAFRGGAEVSNVAEVLTWVCNNGAGKVRQDGADVATALNYTQRAISGATKLGCNIDGLSDFFSGKLYGLVLVDRAMTAGEIASTEAHLDAKF